MEIDSSEFAKVIVSQYLPEAKANVVGTENLAAIIRSVFASGVNFGRNGAKDQVVKILVAEHENGNVQPEVLQAVLGSFSGLAP